MQKKRHSPCALFRADVSRNIGVGHVMRCMALAETLKKEGWKIIYAVREQEDGLGWFADMDGELLSISDQISIDSEPEYIRTQLTAPVDLLVIDNYAIDMQWQSACRIFANTVMAIDDLADRDMDCDLLLNQNPGATSDAYKTRVPEVCSKLIGPDYALLRTQFILARERVAVRSQEIRRILISMGGTDPMQQTDKVLAAVGLLKETDLQFDVVIDSDGPDRDSLQAKAACLSHKVTFHRSVKDMAALMVQADLAIGTAGVTALERCALSLPSILIVVADNQLPSAEALADSGAAINLGWYADVTAEMIAAAMQELMRDQGKMEGMRHNAGCLVDGYGAKRVVAAIKQWRDEGRVLQFRAVTKEDDRLLLDWANDPVVREYSFHPEPISWEPHVAWLDARLEDESCLFLMAEQNNNPVGHVRFEISDSDAEISITVSPSMRGCGVGQSMLHQGLLELAEHKPGIKVIAHVMKGNVASQRLFERCGFRNITQDDAEHLTYIYVTPVSNGKRWH